MQQQFPLGGPAAPPQQPLGAAAFYPQQPPAGGVGYGYGFAQPPPGAAGFPQPLLQQQAQQPFPPGLAGSVPGPHFQPQVSGFPSGAAPWSGAGQQQSQPAEPNPRSALGALGQIGQRFFQARDDGAGSGGGGGGGAGGAGQPQLQPQMMGSAFGTASYYNNPAYGAGMPQPQTYGLAYGQQAYGQQASFQGAPQQHSGLPPWQQPGAAAAAAGGMNPGAAGAYPTGFNWQPQPSPYGAGNYGPNPGSQLGPIGEGSSAQQGPPTSWIAAPEDAAAGGAEAEVGGRLANTASALRRRMLARRQQQEAEASDDQPKPRRAAPQIVRKPLRMRINEEHSFLKPLLLDAGGRWLARAVHAFIWRMLGLFTSPEAWLEKMFHDDDGKEAPTQSSDWLPADDGLYRAPSNVHLAEPWNRERLHLQLKRAFRVWRRSGDKEALRRELAELLMDEDRELVSCATCAPRIAWNQESAAPAGVDGESAQSLLALRTRSHVELRRQQLSYTQLYELRLDISRITLLCAPSADELKGRCAAFESRECQAAGELQDLFQQYTASVDADLTSQLDSRLDALVEHGRGLVAALAAEETAAREAGAEEAQVSTHEAYLKHLEERQKLRLRRDEHEEGMEDLARQLYAKWRELRHIRETQGFVSTPWRLRAQPEEHEPAVDQDRRRRNVEAEVEELVSLKSLEADRVRANVEHRWELRRAPGSPTYRFELQTREELTSTEALNARLAEEQSQHLAEEILRRRQIGKVRVYVLCRVGERIIGASPPFPLHWESWSTASPSTLGSNLTVEHRKHSPGPLHSFDLAVHFMPHSVSLTVCVSLSSGWGAACFTKSYTTAEVEVEIPGMQGRRVTHAAVLDQSLRFGSSTPSGGALAADAAEDDGFGQGFGGEVAVSVSWPGAASGGFVVPPSRRPTGMEAASRRSDSWLSCLAAQAGHHGPPRRPPQPVDERLMGLHYDPQDPENARMLRESPAPKALPGYDLHRLKLEHCRLEQPVRTKRLSQLLYRAEREGVDSERILVPAFEREVFTEEDEVDPDSPFSRRHGHTERLLSEHQKEFIHRVKERLRKVAIVKTHMSYQSIVREHGEQAEESNLFEKLEKIWMLFQPKRTLRPAQQAIKLETSAHMVRIHVSLAKVYNTPIRAEDPTLAAAAAAGVVRAPGPPSRSATGIGAGPRGFAASGMLGGGASGALDGYPPAHGQISGFGTGPGHDSSFGRADERQQLVFGEPSSKLPRGVLPEIVVEMSLEDLDGNVLHSRTTRVAPSADPDVNQILEVCLTAGSKEELSQESLQRYGGCIALNIFDEVALAEPERGGQVLVRHQRRHLGRFVLPWSSLYASKCSVKGHFRVEQPFVIFGYTNKPVDRKVQEPGTEISNPVAMRRATGPEPMCMSIDVTVDPALVPPERVQTQIAKGKETSVLIKHVQKWLDSFGSQKDRHITAFGTDIDGRSRLVCRFVRPQRPPMHIDPADPFAIEAAARYVSLIPFMNDNELFPKVTDLWCTDQEFLSIQCGDWEEHAILLCNYFNYIDRYRREQVSGYSNIDVQSYCMLCDVLPEGEIAMVLRRDHHSGHCELWQASSGDCYFLPKQQPRQGFSLFQRGADLGEDQPEATPLIPIQRVHVIFNEENVWANVTSAFHLSRVASGTSHFVFDVNDTSHWRPLFPGGWEQLSRLSQTPTTPRPDDSAVHSPGDDYRPRDASEILRYQPEDKQHAKYVESKFESQLEHEIREYRAMGEHTGVQQTTVFNRVIGLRFGELLEELEALSNCSRRVGNESVFPLRSHAAPPVSLDAIHLRMQEVERAFQTAGGSRGHCVVYGLPIQQAYMDVARIWNVIKESRILEMGDEKAEYALKVRVFPYASQILSVWVFVAVSMSF